MEADLQPAQIHLTSAKLYVKPVLVTDVSANTLCDEAEISTLSAIKRGNAFQTSDVPVKKTKLSQRGPAVDKQVGAMCRILPPLNTSGLLLLVNCSFMNHEDIKPRVIFDKDVYETAIILNSLSNDNYCDQQLTIPSKENCIWYNLELDGFLTDISEEGSSQTDFDLMMCEIEVSEESTPLVKSILSRKIDKIELWSQFHTTRTLINTLSSLQVWKTAAPHLQTNLLITIFTMRHMVRASMQRCLTARIKNRTFLRI